MLVYLFNLLQFQMRTWSWQLRGDIPAQHDAVAAAAGRAWTLDQQIHCRPRIGHGSLLTFH